jgi:hypothetical protein
MNDVYIMWNYRRTFLLQPARYSVNGTPYPPGRRCRNKMERLIAGRSMITIVNSAWERTIKSANMINHIFYCEIQPVLAGIVRRRVQ